MIHALVYLSFQTVSPTQKFTGWQFANLLLMSYWFYIPSGTKTAFSGNIISFFPNKIPTSLVVNEVRR